MGCTSSKSTRTKSTEDLAGQKDAPGDAGPQVKKNGQVVPNDVITREKAPKQNTEAPNDASKAIQIPGAHKSFLAPDGIPFIDEDVDDEIESGGTTRVVVAKADVNKNTVTAVNTARQTTPTVVVAPPTVVVAGQKPSAQELEEEERKKAVAADILRRELDIATAKQSSAEVTGDVRIEQVVVTTTHTSVERRESPRPITEEEQQKAAVKIQAGIRGYRDRQKVKAIRAAKEHPTNGPDASQHTTDHALAHSDRHDDKSRHSPEEDAAIKIQASYKGFKARQQVRSMKEHAGECEVVCNEQHTEEQHLQPPGEPQGPPPPSPEMERAATKIQASYKGYKTRKQLGKIHHDN